jgi:hypothetical protein
MREFAAAVADQPGLVDGYMGLGKALYRQGKFDAALPRSSAVLNSVQMIQSRIICFTRSFAN